MIASNESSTHHAYVTTLPLHVAWNNSGMEYLFNTCMVKRGGYVAAYDVLISLVLVNTCIGNS